MTTSLGLVDAFEKAAQIRRNRSRGLRDLSLFSPVAAADDGGFNSMVGNRDAAAGGSTPSVRVTRDTRTEGSISEPGNDGLGQMSAWAGKPALSTPPPSCSLSEGPRWTASPWWFTRLLGCRGLPSTSVMSLPGHPPSSV